MEQRDLEMIERHMTDNESLKHLYEEHLDFERQLEKYNDKPALTPAEEMERKNLQKLKLLGRDKMEMILAAYRKQERA
jgi:hypothetical protein